MSKRSTFTGLFPLLLKWSYPGPGCKHSSCRPLVVPMIKSRAEICLALESGLPGQSCNMFRLSKSIWRWIILYKCNLRSKTYRIEGSAYCKRKQTYRERIHQVFPQCILEPFWLFSFLEPFQAVKKSSLLNLQNGSRKFKEPKSSLLN